MSPFIETILAEHGVAQNILFHQVRVNKTLHDFHSDAAIDIVQALNKLALAPIPKAKIRLLYNEEGIIEITQDAYQRKEIQSVSLVEIGARTYPHKYADRKWIYALLAEAGTDEMIMVKNGHITDTSIANLAFHDGTNWYTPASPLLEGTRRAALIQQMIVTPIPIPLSSLHQFTSFKYFNSLISWNESPVLDMRLVVG